MVIVCDKCRKPMQKPNPISLKGRKIELCDSCADKIISWLDKRESGFLSFLGGNQ